MTRRSSVLAFGMALAIATPGSGYAQLGQVDKLAEQFMKEEGVVGMAVAVMKGGRILHAKGYGYADLENEGKATETTVFRIASLSKQFTAMAVLMLMEKGKLSLEDDITRYFRDFPTKGRKLTIAQLLNHTSGMAFEEAWTKLAPDASVSFDTPRDLSPSVLSTLFEGTQFEFSPGDRYRYNNNAYGMLGLLIERVSGISYAAFLQKNIWEPLGMTQTYYLDATRIVKHRANGYTMRDGAVVNAASYNVGRGYSAAAVGSTVLDLMTWERALLGNRLILPSTFKAMTSPAMLNDGTAVPYGFGLFLLEMEGKRKIEHYGNVTGFRAQLAHYPSDDLTVSVLANTNPARTELLESRIARAIMGIPEKNIVEVPLSADQLRRYAGTYLVKDAPISHRSGTTQIRFTDSGLVAGVFRFRSIGNNVFVPVGDPYHRYTFAMSGDESVGLRVEREGRLIADGLKQD